MEKRTKKEIYEGKLRLYEKIGINIDPSYYEKILQSSPSIKPSARKVCEGILVRARIFRGWVSKPMYETLEKMIRGDYNFSHKHKQDEWRHTFKVNYKVI